MDLSPRSTTDLTPPAAVPPAAGKPRSKRRNLTVGVALAVLFSVAAIILFQGLSNAGVYFCNADEVGKRADCSGTGRFRLQGVVDQGTVKQLDTNVTFTVSYGGVTIPVVHTGDPGGIFKEGIPVVVEGRMVDNVFQSDLLMVKHSEQYRQKHPDRVSVGGP